VVDKQRELVEYINKHLNKPFEWGVLDCHFLAGIWVDIITGGSKASGYIGKYKTKTGAVRAFKEKGPVILEYLKEVQAIEVVRNFEQNGDIVQYETKGDKFPHFAIYYRGRLLIATYDQGVILAPIRNFLIKNVFRIN
jgi:hypothetical protein